MTSSGSVSHLSQSIQQTCADATDTDRRISALLCLAYWIVFSSLTCIESLFLRLVMYYMPFYFVFKTVFIIWLQLPATRVRPRHVCLCRRSPHLADHRINSVSTREPRFSLSESSTP